MTSFMKHSEPLISLGVGQKKIIYDWLDEMGVINYTINDDLTIDCTTTVNLHLKNLDEIPDYINFNRVNGSFSCAHNNLISLRGCPKYVNGNFYCCSNTKYFTKDDVKEICQVGSTINTSSVYL